MNGINDNNYMQWVERFLDAETTIDQERELYAYFSRRDLPDGARKYREMFGWYDDMQPSASLTQGTSPVRLLPLRLWQWACVAAVMLLLFATGFLLRPSAAVNEFIGDDGYVYSGYMIHNGKKTTDMAIVSAEMDRITNEMDRDFIDLDEYLDDSYPQIPDVFDADVPETINASMTM